MTATQQERKRHALSPRARARADGYLDGLYGVLPRREMQPPLERFAYDAGYADGEKARKES